MRIGARPRWENVQDARSPIVVGRRLCLSPGDKGPDAAFAWLERRLQTLSASRRTSRPNLPPFASRPVSTSRFMSKKISKTAVNFWLDALLLVLFVVLCWSSLIVRYVFPPGPQSQGWQLWGWDYMQWSDFQFAALCLLALGILIHVMLHWSWVCGVVASRVRQRQGASAAGKKDDGSRTLWGVGLLIMVCNVIGLGVAAAVLTVQGPTP